MKKTLTFSILAILIYNFTYAQMLDVVAAKYTGKPIIKMTINHQKTWVLLDTGSDITILDTEMKDKYGFVTFSNNEPALNVPGFGSSNNQLEKTGKVEIHFGEVRLHGQIYAFDLTSVMRSIHRRTGKRVTAIIGTNMMRAYGFVLDMRNGTAMIPVKKKKKSMRNNAIMESAVAQYSSHNE